MSYDKIIQEKLKRLREMKELKQEDIATIINKSRQCYNQYENGVRKIDIEQLCKIADEFDLPLDWFTGRDIETNKRLRNK